MMSAALTSSNAPPRSSLRSRTFMAAKARGSSPATPAERMRGFCPSRRWFGPFVGSSGRPIRFYKAGRSSPEGASLPQDPAAYRDARFLVAKGYD